MAARQEERKFTANEAACVTGVSLKEVHRIIDAGLLGVAVHSRGGARIIPSKALPGLKLAHATTGMLTLEGRRRLVRRLFEEPEARTVSADAVAVDVRQMKNDVRRGLTTLEKAKNLIIVDDDILGGAPCFKGTRIAVHDIAGMIANGDEVAAVLAAYPTLTQRHVDAAIVYAMAYPRRGRPRRRPVWRRKKPISSDRIAYDKLPRVS